MFARSRVNPPVFPEASSDLALPSFVPVDDADLGVLSILQESDEYDPLNVSISSGLFYTNNAGLDEIDEIEDEYWWAAAGVSYIPQIAGGLAGDFSVSYQTFRYDSSGFLDFDELEVGAGLVYVAENFGNLAVSVRYNYDRIVEPREWTEVFVQHGIVAGLFKPFLIDRNHFFYIRGTSEFGLKASTDVHGHTLEQNDYNGVLGYRFSVTDDLSLEPYYRVRFLDFENGREDLLQTVGLGVSYRLSEAWFAAITGSYTTNDSNHPFGDFEAGTVGGQIGFQARF